MQKPQNTTTNGARGLQRKVKEEKLIVTKADKSNAIVVMERSLYDSKVYYVLQQCGAKENSEFNFSNHVQEVRDAINDSTVLIKSARLKKVLLTPNPTPPLL